tara:strand:- start:38 stop:943 length:906 start_codon:yes stop_codon:yes gene_type:complete
MIQSFSSFSKLFEGGAAIKSSRPIKESEVEKTIQHMREVLFPLIGDGELDKDYLLIGSIGKKKSPSDTSGDIDLGLSQEFLAQKFGISADQSLQFLYDKLSTELPAILGYEPDMKLMKGINVLSIAWPIEGNTENGTVQLDLIPISDMDWAKFIFYSPDYRKNESKYKSAHRNWLFQAILSALKNVTKRDENEDIVDFDTYALRLNDGIYKNKKTFQGATKRLKRPDTVKGQSVFVTRDPQELLDLMFGGGVKPDNVKSFEDVWNIVTSPNFKYSDKVEEIRQDLIRYLNNAGYVIPTEVA